MSDEKGFDEQAVGRFAQAMNVKMDRSRAKGRSGWWTMPNDVLWQMLREHVEKGDPVDVANFAMMIWNNQQCVGGQPETQTWVGGVGSTSVPGATKCGCITCQATRAESLPPNDILGRFCGMDPHFRYACEICGNKRCPHHTDHRLACTGSNESGQAGSVYE